MIKAVVFDMDGVLVDTEYLLHKRLMSFYAAHGLNRPESDYFDFIGCSHEYYQAHMDQWWAQTPIKTEEERSLSAQVVLANWMKEDDIDYAALLNPGVCETISALQSQGIKTAIASSTSHKGIFRALNASGIYGYFDPIVSGEDVLESKPSPDIYLAACELMHLSTSDCIAVEDSDKGIAAALAAGLRVVVKRELRFGFLQGGGTWYIDDIPGLLPIVDAEM